MGSIAKPSVQFNIRMDATIKERIEKAAQLTCQSLTEFTESILAAKADEILAQHEQIRLSEKDYDLFVQLMTSDSEPTAIARKEAAEFNEGQIEGSRYRW